MRTCARLSRSPAEAVVQREQLGLARTVDDDVRIVLLEGRQALVQPVQVLLQIIKAVDQTCRKATQDQARNKKSMLQG